MLIETDPVDWSKPIVFFNAEQQVTMPALLVSTNYKGSNTTPYVIVAYSPDDKVSDAVHYVTTEGKIGQRRYIYNTDTVNIKNKQLEQTIALSKDIKGFGEF